MKKPVIRIWSVLFWLLVWQAASIALNKNRLLTLLSSPVEVLQSTAAIVVTPVFWQSVGFTFLRIAGGFLTAALLAVLLASLAARFRRIEELLAPAMLTVKTVPVASFIILALILFSSRNLSFLISFLMVLPVLYTNTLAGIRETDASLLEMAELFRIPKLRRIRYLYLPQVMPYFRAGMGVALGLCWKAGVAAEVIGIPQGSVGEHLQQAKVYLDVPALFSWTLIVVLLSLVFEKLVLFLSDRLLRLLIKD